MSAVIGIAAIQVLKPHSAESVKKSCCRIVTRQNLKLSGEEYSFDHQEILNLHNVGRTVTDEQPQFSPINPQCSRI
jgi:hypothetical protein